MCHVCIDFDRCYEGSALFYRHRFRVNDEAQEYFFWVKLKGWENLPVQSADGFIKVIWPLLGVSGVRGIQDK